MGEIERPDEKVLRVWWVSSLLSWGVFGLIVLGVLSLFVWRAHASVWLLGWALLPLGCWAVSTTLLRRQWERWTFRVSPDALEMSHGLLFRQQRIVARDRIQHVDFNSGPFDRKFGLVQVVVHTAGATVGMIPGVATERAQRLREELMSGPKAV
jgi:membrane protein YdbS with pleckstrin-like domain